MKFMSFSSGSCGNCYYLGDGHDGVLIDAGISLRRLKSLLSDNGLSFDSFSSIFVTHDHLDHIRHLGSYCKRLGKPVYTNAVIHRALSEHTFTRDWISSCRIVLKEGVNEIPCCLEGICDKISVSWFVVPHDATQTVGYEMVIGGHIYVHITDCGKMTDEALEVCRRADTLVLESNYDLSMLLCGPYPEELRKRIYGGNGHLSNDECADALRKVWHPGLRNVFLCHLSENNNTPELAYAAALAGVMDASGLSASLPSADPSRENGPLSSTAPAGTRSVAADRPVASTVSAQTSLRCLPRQTPSPLFTILP